MSLFTISSITCTQCARIYPTRVVGSLNADRRPDLRQSLLDNHFQDAECPNCGHSVRLAPNFTYIDSGRGQWIVALPAGEMPHYRSYEARVAELFDRSYGAGAPASARSLGAALAPRVTFGWPAVREKVLIRELGLDDTLVELVKLDLVRRVPSIPLRPGIEQRMVGMDDGRMRFEWLGSDDEAPLSGLSVGRELYDTIAADTPGWQATRALLSEGCFVDMQKTYMHDGPVDAMVALA